MLIHTIEHVPFEGPAAIADHASVHGHQLTRTRIFAGEPLPDMEEIDLLAVMGGPMSVHDVTRFPWLVREKEFIRRAVVSGRSILGVCLGAQLLAEVLEARVSRNPQREIGWHDLRLTLAGEAAPVFAGFPERFSAFHWHGETFSIPEGGVCVASSEACVNQAFALGTKLVGLQFHLETTRESMELLIENAEAVDLVPGPYVQTPGKMREGLGIIPDMRNYLDILLTNMIKEV